MSPTHIPDGYHSITPYLVIKGAKEAIRFYQKAFGAKEVMRFEHEGEIAHAELEIAGSRVMLGEENPMWGNRSPLTLGGVAGGLAIWVPDVDQAFAQAVAAGGKAEQPPTDQFYGDRSGNLVDPFGHKWNICTHKEDIPMDEMQRRFRDFMAQMSQVPSA
jgi:PhnB protein